MARGFGLLFVLWLVAACLGITTTTTTPAPSTVNDTVATTLAPSTGNDTVATTLAPPTGNVTVATTPAPSTGNDTVATTPAPSTGNDTVATTPAPSTGNDNTVTTPATSTGNDTVATTLAPPTGNVTVATTPAPSTGNDTVATTLGPSTGNVTVATTPAPSTGNDTVATTPAPSTGNDTVATTLAPPTGNGTTVTLLPSDPCELNQCGPGITCEPRFNGTFECLCQLGGFYNELSKSCVRAKVFPGQLHLTGLTYSEEMKNNKSEEFLKTSQRIISALDDAFRKKEDYSGSTVVELRNGTNSNPQSRSENSDPVNATVEIIFSASSDVIITDVQDTIANAPDCETCLLGGASFLREDPCKLSDPCDKDTTRCTGDSAPVSCDCTDDYVKSEFSTTMCIACPSGQKAETSKCVNCPFGYSGFNCNESWKLDLVIVGSVLGGLLLITMILLPVVALKSSKKRSKKNKDTGELHFSLSPAQGPLLNSSTSQANLIHGSANAVAIAGVSTIPRATATSSWDRTSPESSLGHRRQNLAPEGRNSNNPYAQKQGHSNPYYVHDD